MNKKERVWRTLEFQEVDFLPYKLSFLPPVARKLREYFKVDDIERKIGNHLYSLHPSWRIKDKGKYESVDKFGISWRRNGVGIDPFGVVWKRYGDYDRGYPLRPPLREVSLRDYVFPNAYEDRDFTEIEEKINENRDLFLTCSIGDLFERAHFLRGLEELLRDFYLRPRFVEELLDKIMEFDIAVARQTVELDIDGIFISDDYGDQKGLMMKPDLWRKFIKLRLGRIVEVGKRKGLKVFLHSDGNILEIIPDLIEVGVDVIHPVQPEIFNLKFLKDRYGDRLCFYGGISTQKTLPFGTCREVKAEVRKRIEQLGRGGGYIIGPAIDIQRDVPLENVLALIEAVQNQ